MREPKCPLCKALFNEDILDGMNATFGDDAYGILPTKDMKGHAERIQVIRYDHDSKGNYEKASMLLFDFIVRNHRDHDWAIMEPTHASIPDHFHLVATTIDDERAEDEDLIEDTDRIEIRFKRRKWKAESDNKSPCKLKCCGVAWCTCDDCPMCRGNTLI